MITTEITIPYILKTESEPVSKESKPEAKWASIPTCVDTFFTTHPERIIELYGLVNATLAPITVYSVQPSLQAVATLRASDAFANFIESSVDVYPTLVDEVIDMDFLLILWKSLLTAYQTKRDSEYSQQ